MTVRSEATPDIATLLGQLVAVGDDAPSPRTKRQIAQRIREESKEASNQVDDFLLREVARLRAGLERAQDRQRKLAEIFDRLSAPPWHAALFLGAVETGTHQVALVAHGHSRSVVGLGESVDIQSLGVGDEVFLGPELNLIVAPALGGFHMSGETAVFDRFASSDRLVLRSRDEEVVVQAAETLRGSALQSGDLVRWDREQWLAFERVERSAASHLFVEDTPLETFDAIGGLDRQIDELQWAIRLHREHGAIAQRYGITRAGSVLLEGPPGNGKTLIARALANWVASLAPAGRSRFMNLKPGSLHSVWYSQSEANYREAFRVARAASEEDPGTPVVMFFDEVDAAGAARGGTAMRVDDRVLTAFMTELDGLESRGNVLVVAATNRRDALDPALLRPGRLGDLVLTIPRPNRDAASEIFARHLRVAPLYCSEAAVNGGPTAEELIDAAVSRIYAPNGHGELATIGFRDGKRRSVSARDLVSGAVIEKIVQTTLTRAGRREIETGEAGVQLADLFEAIDDEFNTAAQVLAPGNCHRYLDDLPQDVDVVRVEPVVRQAKQLHRYVSLT